MEDNEVGKNLRILAEEGLKLLEGHTIEDVDLVNTNELENAVNMVLQYGVHILESNNIKPENMFKEIVEPLLVKIENCDNFIKRIITPDFGTIFNAISDEIISAYKRRFSLDETQEKAITFVILATLYYSLSKEYQEKLKIGMQVNMFLKNIINTIKGCSKTNKINEYLSP